MSCSYCPAVGTGRPSVICMLTQKKITMCMPCPGLPFCMSLICQYQHRCRLRVFVFLPNHEEEWRVLRHSFRFAFGCPVFSSLSFLLAPGLSSFHFCIRLFLVELYSSIHAHVDLNSLVSPSIFHIISSFIVRACLRVIPSHPH